MKDLCCFSVQSTRVQKLHRCHCINQGALRNVLDWNIFVWPMRNGQEAGTIRECRNTSLHIPAYFQQLWAHLEMEMYYEETGEILHFML